MMPRASLPHTCSLLCAAAVLATLVASPASLVAQRASVLTGKVVADVTTRVLADAEIQILALKRLARTDSTGIFAIDGLPAGSHNVVVRHVGYEPLAVTIDFTGTDTLARVFVLDRVTMPTSASAPPDSVNSALDKFRDFRRRRARGLGHFVVREQFERYYERPLSEVLRRLPGLMLQRNMRNPGVAVASSRGVPSTTSLSGGEGYPQMCYVQLYVDGVRIFAAGHGQTPVNINDWRTVDVEAIEYFSGPDQTPPEFNGAGAVCGTLSLWLRIE